MIKQYNEKVTPKQFAKVAIMDKLFCFKEFWEERWEYSVNDMTEKEKEAVQQQIQKQVDRVCNYLGGN